MLVIVRCAAAATAVVLLAAGCTSGGSPSSSAASSHRPGNTTAGRSTATITSPTARTSAGTVAPGTWSTAVAQRNYLAYVAPRNRDSTTLGILLQQQSTSLRLFHTTCGALARDEDALARNLATGRWPASARAEVAAFVPILRRIAGVHRTCAAATSVPKAIAAIATVPRSQTQADTVRVALGLKKAG